MIKDILTIVKIINNALTNAYEEGLIQTDSEGNLTPSMLFPFNVSEIEGVHTHKKGAGDGVFFRLKDGRVFNRFGEVEDSDLSLYDKVEN